jgi:hypothetical protein
VPEEQPYLVLVRSAVLRGTSAIQVCLYDTYLIKRARLLPGWWRSQRVEFQDVRQIDLQTAGGRRHLSLRTELGEVDLSGFSSPELALAADFIRSRSST